MNCMVPLCSLKLIRGDDTIKFVTFMRLMNHALRSLIGKCVVVYFDDILIYSTSLNDHLLHVKNVTFDSFVVGSHGVEVDEEKEKAIQDWPTPKTMGEVRSFHGLASFYRRFERLTQAPILTLQKFSKSFELECNASSVVILQEGHPISYFSEKLKGSKLNYSTYDRELYQGKMNVVVDAFSRRHALIAMLEKDMLGLDCIKELYEKYFFRHDGFLFNGKRLCMQMSSIKQLHMKEEHESGYIGQFGEFKTSEI
ncbi:Retrovirus-related Pol polyprotein from transposon 17.6, partial [Mucuna pruriens]